MNLLKRMTALLPAPLQGRLKALRASANKRPRLTAGLLLAFALVNFGLLLLTGSRTSKAFDYPWNETQSEGRMLEDHALSKHSPPIPYSLRNFLEMRSIRDSLELLRVGGFRTRQDTLMFLRILGRYARLDTSFARQLARGHVDTDRPENLKNTPK
jgi:hypothetical protein